MIDTRQTFLDACNQAVEEIRAEVRRDCLFELLQVKFSPIAFDVCGRLERASPNLIKVWLRRIAIVDTIEKVFEA
jgi:hypothetical protein